MLLYVVITGFDYEGYNAPSLITTSKKHAVRTARESEDGDYVDLLVYDLDGGYVRDIHYMKRGIEDTDEVSLG